MGRNAVTLSPWAKCRLDLDSVTQGMCFLCTVLDG